MEIDEKTVRHIARLARLAVTPEESRLYQGQLGAILGHMDELRGLDTSKVPPTASVLGLSNVTRPDVPRPFEAPEKLLDNAPLREGAFFRVAKVLE